MSGQGLGWVATYPDHLRTGIVGRPKGKSRSQGRRLRTHRTLAIPPPGLLGCPPERQQVETEGGVTPAPCLQTLPGMDALLGSSRDLVPVLPQPHSLCMLMGARDPRSQRAEAGPRGMPYPCPGSPTGAPGPCLQPRPLGRLPWQPWGQAAATVLARVGPEAGSGLSSPAAGLQQAVANLQRRHAEVCDPDVILLVQQKVFWFQIPVAGRKAGLRLIAAAPLKPRLTAGGQWQRSPLMSPAVNRRSPSGRWLQGGRMGGQDCQRWARSALLLGVSPLSCFPHHTSYLLWASTNLGPPDQGYPGPRASESTKDIWVGTWQKAF